MEESALLYQPIDFLSRVGYCRCASGQDFSLHRLEAPSIMMWLLWKIDGWRQRLLPSLIQSPAYWTGSFKVTRPDVEFLFSQFLEQERPLSDRDLALRLIRHRIAQEEEKLKKQIERGT